MANLATLADLKGRLDWTLDADEERIGNGALEDLSNFARHHAGSEWPTEADAPRLARTLVLKAAARYMRNPAGYTQSRAGDEQLGWNDDIGENAGTAYFTEDEVRLLQELGGKRGGIVSVPTTAWRTKRTVHREFWPNGYEPIEGFVPVDGSNEKPFPFFVSDDEDDW